MNPIKYQAHIDGLRAIAVLLVIFHHLGDWGGLSGGFAGVDVFFVISGFLITSIVKSELEAGQFSIAGFYKKRVIRLVPAYFLILLVTTAAALLWMLPAELLAYARSVIASSLFLANFHMWQEVGGYFGAAAETAPLLHLWSLAVEEQFYLFWPLAMLLAHWLLPRHWLPWLVLAVVVVGALASQWGVERYPAAAYYLLPTRFFELAIGALLAYWPMAEQVRRWHQAAAAGGLALVGYSALAYNKETLFPGYAALVPVLGTAMVLRWGQADVVGRLLGNPVATFVGRVSYPAYLWHWPIIVFFHLNEVPITLPTGIGIVLATLGLAWLTYRWVELPARRLRNHPAGRVIAMVGAAPIAASVVLGMVLIGLQGLPGRFSDSLNHKSLALQASASKARGRCNEGPPTAPLPAEQCILGRPDGQVDFLLVGDSHANHFSGFMDVLASQAGLRGYDMTRSNTPFLADVERWTLRNGAEDLHENFRLRNRYVADLLQRERYGAVVLAGNYTGFYNQEILRGGSLEGRAAFEASMREAIRLADGAADKVILIKTIPLLSDRLHDCTLRAERFGQPLDCTLPATLHREETGDLTRFFAQLQQEFPELVVIEPDTLLCGPQACITELDGTPLYKDDGHLNDIGSRLLAQIWLQEFGNPLSATAKVDAVTPSTQLTVTP